MAGLSAFCRLCAESHNMFLGLLHPPFGRLSSLANQQDREGLSGHRFRLGRDTPCLKYDHSSLHRLIVPHLKKI